MSGILRRVGIAWFVICTVNVYINSAQQPGKPSDNGNPPPPGNGNPPPPGGIDPLCSTDLCLTYRNQSMYPVGTDCTYYYRCVNQSALQKESCKSPGELFSKYSFKCESTQNRSVCLQCPPTATSLSSSTTSKNNTSLSTTTTSITPSSTTPKSTTKSSTTPGSSTPNSTTPVSTTPSSTTPGSTTPSSTTPGSTTPSSTTPGSSTPSSTTPVSTTPSSTTPGSTIPSSTTPGSTTPSSTTPGSTIQGLTTSGSTTLTPATSESSTSSRPPTPVPTTPSSTTARSNIKNSTITLESTSASSHVQGSTTSWSTTSTGQDASYSATSSSTSVTQSTGNISEDEATGTGGSNTHDMTTSKSSAASINSTDEIHGATTESDSTLDSSTSTVPAAVVSSNNTTPTVLTTTSTTMTSSTAGTSNIVSASNTDSTNSTTNTLSSALSTSTLVPSSNASSLAAPSSGSPTLGKPDNMTSTSTMTLSSALTDDSSKVATQESDATSPSTTSPVTTERYRREILFTRASPGIVSEGTDLKFECAFIWQTNFGYATVDEFIWILNGKQVVSTGRITIQQQTLSSDGFWKSTIRFNPALSQDSDNLTCCATTSGFMNATYQLFEVLPKPNVTITPRVTTVRDGENGALLVCTVYATLTSNRTTGNVRRLTWLQNGRALKVEEYLDFYTNSSIQHTVSTLNLTSLESDVTVTCLVETSFVNVSSGETIVRVMKIVLGNPCPAETAARIDWGMTTNGNFDIQSCPNGWSGLARRDCNMDSTWNPPDLDNCIAQIFIDLQIEVNGIRDRNDILDNMTMSQLAETIAEAISNSSNMTSAELEKSVEILSTMSEIHVGGDSDVSLGPTELKAMMKAIDYLLNVSSWERAPQNLAISLLATINVYSDMYALQYRNPGIFIVSKNLVYEADGMQADSTISPSYGEELLFPDWTKVNWTTDEASFWANSNETVIYMKRQATLKLLQEPAFSSASPVNFSSSCIRNLGKYLPLTMDQKMKGSYINSNVITLTFPDFNMSSGEDELFVISAQHLQPETNISMTGVCVFWDFSANENESWAESGCKTISSNATHTSCNCTHLTNFAILFGPVNADGVNDVPLSIISMVGCIISVIALFLTILLYLTQWKKMKSKRAGVLINLCISLIIANIIFLAGSDKTQPEVGCTVVAALLHYFFLAAFFLMLLEGAMLVIYVIFVFAVLRLAHTVAMIIAAWVIPAVIVGISLGVTKTKGYGTKTTCWLSVEENVLWAFVAPALFIILVNLIIIVIVLSRIARTKVRSDLKKKRNKLLSMLRNIVILSPIMGVTWIFGVLSVDEKTVAFQYIFAITNSLQGLFIFILHGLCHAKNKKSSSSTSKPKNRRITGILSRSSAPHMQIPLSGTDSQEDLVQRTKQERELYAEEILSKQNSVHNVQKVRFGHQLSNTSNGTALTMLSNTSSTNGRTSSTIVSS